MDVNGNNQDHDDTIGSIDDVGSTNDTNHANTDDNSVGIPDREAYHRPLKRNNRGQFVAAQLSVCLPAVRPLVSCYSLAPIAWSKKK